MSMVIIEHGGIAKAALNPINRTINSKPKTSVDAYCTLAQGAEMAVE
jgi:hypothetical protein